MSGLEAQNVGLGPALHITVVAQYGSPGSGWAELTDHISALAVNEARPVDNIDTRRPMPMNREFYGAVHVRYEDMFGNCYATSYSNFAHLRYEYSGRMNYINE